MTIEVWKIIEQFPKYEVSTFGNVKNIETQHILKQNVKNGYKYVSLILDYITKKSVTVHRLVALTFISNPENKKTVNHKDHNPMNNNIVNLEWFTQTEQNQHSIKCDKKIQELIGARKVWRIEKKTDEKLELYPSIKYAAQWIFNNRLTKITEFNDGSSLKSQISAVAQGKKIAAYGYKWMYEQENKLVNEIWKKIPLIFVNGTEGYFISSLGRIKNNKGQISCGYSS
jgi:hypothetical protein